mmetsp:Transcript_67073/g.162167  ORF Transcript_67073/g.162167 Transcript_67073/m.162167 type:complete len:273 (-) Transcript_67073:44-862(-)
MAVLQYNLHRLDELRAVGVHEHPIALVRRNGLEPDKRVEMVSVKLQVVAQAGVRRAQHTCACEHLGRSRAVAGADDVAVAQRPDLVNSGVVVGPKPRRLAQDLLLHHRSLPQHLRGVENQLQSQVLRVLGVHGHVTRRVGLDLAGQQVGGGRHVGLLETDLQDAVLACLADDRQLLLLAGARLLHSNRGVRADPRDLQPLQIFLELDLLEHRGRQEGLQIAGEVDRAQREDGHVRETRLQAEAQLVLHCRLHQVALVEELRRRVPRRHVPQA